MAQNAKKKSSAIYRRLRKASVLTLQGTVSCLVGLAVDMKILG